MNEPSICSSALRTGAAQQIFFVTSPGELVERERKSERERDRCPPPVLRRTHYMMSLSSSSAPRPRFYSQVSSGTAHVWAEQCAFWTDRRRLERPGMEVASGDPIFCLRLVIPATALLARVKKSSRPLIFGERGELPFLSHPRRRAAEMSSLDVRDDADATTTS